MPPHTASVALPKPRYTHDCKRCRYLGQVACYDLYVCRDSVGHYMSGIARFGSNGPDYASTGFLADRIEETRLRNGGLSEDEAIVLTIFAVMPALILNVWRGVR